MKKADVKDIQSLEEYYTKTRKIRFAEESVIESLDDIYSRLWMTKLYNRENQEATYFMRGAEHCQAYRMRSIDDFIKLSKKYFPELTLKDIFKYLKEKQDSLDTENLRQALSYCPHIRKYNFKGLVNSKYVPSIELYDLRDLNSNMPAMKVSDLLT